MSLFVTYDISNNRLRTQVSKYLMRHGRRLQKSVIEIDNVETKVIKELTTGIKTNFQYRLKNTDSILIINTGKAGETKIKRIGTSIKKTKPNRLVFLG